MSRQKKEKEQDLNMPGEEAVIGETAYMVRRLIMTDWLELKVLLLRLVGPAVAEFFANYTSGKNTDKLNFLDSTNTTMIGAAVYAFTSRADAKEYARFLDILGGCTWVNGKVLGRIGNSTWWPKHMGELAGYIKHALMVQFEDFIDGLRNEMPDSEKKEELDQ